MATGIYAIALLPVVITYTISRDIRFKLNKTLLMVVDFSTWCLIGGVFWDFLLKNKIRGKGSSLNSENY